MRGLRTQRTTNGLTLAVWGPAPLACVDIDGDRAEMGIWGQRRWEALCVRIPALFDYLVSYRIGGHAGGACPGLAARQPEHSREEAGQVATTEATRPWPVPGRIWVCSREVGRQWEGCPADWSSNRIERRKPTERTGSAGPFSLTSVPMLVQRRRVALVRYGLVCIPEGRRHHNQGDSSSSRMFLSSIRGTAIAQKALSVTDLVP